MNDLSSIPLLRLKLASIFHRQQNLICIAQLVHKLTILFSWQSQARECLYEKLLLTSSGGDRTPESDVKQSNFDIDQDINAYLDQAQEAAEVCISSLYYLSLFIR